MDMRISYGILVIAPNGHAYQLWHRMDMHISYGTEWTCMLVMAPNGQAYSCLYGHVDRHVYGRVFAFAHVYGHMCTHAHRHLYMCAYAGA